MRKDTRHYLVTASGVIERGIFYNYMHELGYRDCFMYNRERIINSVYPIVVDMKRKELAIMESATMCYLNDKAGRVKTVEEFKKIIEKKV